MFVFMEFVEGRPNAGERRYMYLCTCGKHSRLPPKRGDACICVDMEQIVASPTKEGMNIYFWDVKSVRAPPHRHGIGKHVCVSMWKAFVRFSHDGVWGMPARVFVLVCLCMKFVRSPEPGGGFVCACANHPRHFPRGGRGRISRWELLWTRKAFLFTCAERSTAFKVATWRGRN